ncbi:PIG-L family deacetylase [Glaciibacter sp. 2TAF33]|uniref:PIG-L family deacetylase n=1 Tax=Glaciibacter sp. 2TAF33 TaxID=3233015 RepID=UPI003F91F663
MVTFSHREAGTPELTWLEAARREHPTSRRLPLGGLARLVVVAAHPDDETLAAGGLLARASRLGVPIVVVVLTDGEASHPLSPTHTPQQLASLRQAEVTDAVGRVAPGASVLLAGLPDGAAAAHRDEAVRAIAEALGTLGAGESEEGPGPDDPSPASPGETWVAAPWRNDGHPDHAAAAQAASIAAAQTGARLWEYPVWAWHWSTPEDAVWEGVSRYVLHLEEAERTAKAAAMAAHQSQVAPLSAQPGDEAIVPPWFAAHFERTWETFISTSDDTAIPDQTASLDAGFFDDFYSGSRDPWGFETRWYERRKRALTLAALPRERFRSALELGCSIGTLTAGLAERCDDILATDIVAGPLEAARERLTGHASVRFERLAFPDEWPPGQFELIVLSEVGYYCSPHDLERLLIRCRSSLTPDGVLIACHWRHPVEGYPQTGDAVHAALARVPGLARTVRHSERDFILEVFEPEPARSVAEREGLTP